MVETITVRHKAVKVTSLGYEAWCAYCNDGSGCTTRDEAQKWADQHNQDLKAGKLPKHVEVPKGFQA